MLIAEACTHHPFGEDIGRVKIPRLLRTASGPADHRRGERQGVSRGSGRLRRGDPLRRVRAKPPGDASLASLALPRAGRASHQLRMTIAAALR